MPRMAINTQGGTGNKGRGRRSEAGGQRSEVRGQRSEVSKNRSQRPKHKTKKISDYIHVGPKSIFAQSVMNNQTRDTK